MVYNLLTLALNLGKPEMVFHKPNILIKSSVGEARKTVIFLVEKGIGQNE